MVGGIKRDVMVDGSIRGYHVVESVTHVADAHTAISVASFDDESMSGIAATTRLSVQLDDTIGFERAYAIVDASPEFAEYVDPAQTVLDELLPLLTDEQAEQVPQAFPAWAVETTYAVGDRVRDDGKLYRCVQAHTSQEGWEPHSTPSLWVRTAPEGEITDWIQPTGAQDAYNTGDKVKHNGKTWVSLVDGNVWEPGTVGTESLWSEVA